MEGWNREGILQALENLVMLWVQQVDKSAGCLGKEKLGRSLCKPSLDPEFTATQRWLVIQT